MNTPTNLDPVAIIWSLVQIVPGVLSALGGLVAGYGLRLWPAFDNQRIPRCVLLASMIFYTLLCAWPHDLTAWQRVQFLLTNMILGAAIGLLVWLFHAKIIKHFESKIPWLGDALQAADDAGNNKKP